MYLRMNYRLYNIHEKQIIFALSYMTGENALLWKQSFWKAGSAVGSLGTWEDFVITL
jgi:hypothetical protein